ncbi:MAG TPA: M35 family metallo-endopeptidase [Roseiflexaceae bacterium]|nr:M35 family metallo-endopeptidase [Roseiflexaceae bacterium]
MSSRETIDHKKRSPFDLPAPQAEFARQQDAAADPLIQQAAGLAAGHSYSLGTIALDAATATEAGPSWSPPGRVAPLAAPAIQRAPSTAEDQVGEASALPRGHDYSFGSIALDASPLASTAGQVIQRTPAPTEEEGICSVCGRKGRGTCPDCGQPFVPVQRMARPEDQGVPAETPGEALREALPGAAAEPAVDLAIPETKPALQQAQILPAGVELASAEQPGAAADTAPTATSAAGPLAGASAAAADAGAVPQAAAPAAPQAAGVPSPVPQQPAQAAAPSAPASQGALAEQPRAETAPAPAAGAATGGNGRESAGKPGSGQAPDTTGQILEMVAQARAGSPPSAGGAASAAQLDPASLRKDPIPMRDGTVTATVDVGQLHAEIAASRSLLLQQAGEQRQRVMAEVAAQQTAVVQAVDAEIARVEARYAQTAAQVTATGADLRTELEANRIAQIGAVNSAADTQLLNLPLVVDQARTDLGAAAERRAADAEAFGLTESQRATTGCTAQAAAARQLGEDKATQYSREDKAADIAAAARQMAGELAGQITSTSQSLAASATGDMGRLAQKFRQDAIDASGNFGTLLANAQSEINRQRQGAVDAINQVTDQALGQIDGSIQQVNQQIQSSQQSAIGQLAQASQSALPGYEQFGAQLCDRIDRDTAMAIASLEQFVEGQVLPQLGDGGEGDQALLDDALEQIRANTTAFSGQLAQSVGEMCLVPQRQTDAIVQSAGAFTAGLDGQLAQIEAGVTAEAGAVKTRVVEETERTASEAIRSIDRVGTELERELTTSATNLGGQWDTELNDGKRALSAKINDALAEHDRAIIHLAQAIDEKAAQIRSRSIFDAIGDFLGSIVDTIGGWLSGISTILGAVFEFVADLVVRLVVGLIELVATVLSFLWEAIKAVITFLYGLVLWIVMALVWLILQGVQLVLELVNWIASFFGGWRALEGWLADLREMLATMGTFLLDPLTPDFHGCDEGQQSKLEHATSLAVQMGSSAQAKLSVTPLDPAVETQFRRFFMSTSAEHIAKARSVLGETLAGLQANPTDMKCEPSSGPQCNGANAYTAGPEIPFVSLHFCSDFLQNSNDRTIAIVVLHEATHKYAGTDDHAYFDAVFSLSTEQALDNADTYEQFVDAIT